MSDTEWSRQGDAWDFLEKLCDLTAEAWLTTASRLRSAAHCNGARRELRALVRRGGLALSAWNLTDGLETAAWYASRHFKNAGWRGRALTRDAIDAARIAALALLLRQQLGERQFWILYEPFQNVFPQQRSRHQRASRVFTESLCGETRGSTNVQESPSIRRK